MRLLLLVTALWVTTLPRAIATHSTLQETAAEAAWCRTHGCGENPPMDDL